MEQGQSEGLRFEGGFRLLVSTWLRQALVLLRNRYWLRRGRTEPMTPDTRWGESFYSAGTIIAGLLVLWVLWSYVFDADRGEPIIRIAPLVLAGVIWLAGWGWCRVLAGR